MKKTLAILLALMLAASAAFTACEETPDTNDDLQNEFNNNDEEETGDGETDEGEEDGEDESDEDSEGDSTTNVKVVDDVVYVLYPANIREEASTKTSVDILAEAPFGAELKRTAELINKKWSKVTYIKDDGEAITGWITNDLITTNKKAVTFDKQTVETQEGETGAAENVITQIKSDLNGRNNAIIRNFPLADGYPNNFKILDAEEFDPSSIVAQIPKGTENIKVISISQDKVWALIEGEGYEFNNGNPAKEKSTVTGYTLYSNLVIAGNSSSNGNSGAIG